MRTERNDPLATTRAEQGAQRVAERTIRDAGLYWDGTVSREVAQVDVPRAIVASYAAREEHADGLRRLVLYGSWEVDPTAVRCTDATEQVPAGYPDAG
jgi:hypothetical protein